MARSLPESIRTAIKCGPIPTLRNWRRIKISNLTRAERIMKFIETFLIVPEGALVGQLFKLDLFQEAFIYSVFDNPNTTRIAILSIARKNGKTGLISGLVGSAVIGPEAIQNSQVRSGALSREQAGIVYKQCEKSFNLNPKLKGTFHCTPSIKRLVGLKKNVEFLALSADAQRAHGQSPALLILDETGQIRGTTGPQNDFVDALKTSQGAHEHPLLIVISTQAPTDSDLLSIWIDDAIRSNDPHTVCHLYAADNDCDMLDREQWLKANPALGTFRNEKDLAEQLKQSERMPSAEASARNLLLNQRIAIENHWLAPKIWRDSMSEISEKVFLEKGACMGLDLSQKNDLTCACLAAKDDKGMFHVKPFSFTPLDGIEERSRRDRVPYDLWVKKGFLIGVPGKTISYEWVSEYLKQEIEDKGIYLQTIEFDRWRINEFKNAADRVGFALWAEWHMVGQGFKDMSPRCEAFETALLQSKLKTGNNPVLNMGAASAIVIRDPAGNIKIDKSKASNKIDALIAAVMALYPLFSNDDDLIGDVGGMIG